MNWLLPVLIITTVKPYKADVSLQNFPAYPDAFKTRISGVFHFTSEVAFSIEQYYYINKNNETGKSILNTDNDLRGLIHDDNKNHSILFNFTYCQMTPLLKNSTYYEPFVFFSDMELSQNVYYAALVDVYKLFQDKSNIDKIIDTTENDTPHMNYIHEGKEGSKYPYTIQANVNHKLSQIDSVLIKKIKTNSSGNKTVQPLITMRYGSIIPISDLELVTLPPHNVLCRADHGVAIPLLNLFYSLEIRVLSEYYKYKNYLSAIKMSEYVEEKMISIGYYSTLETNMHFSRIVHNYATQIGARINDDRGLCAPYSIASNSTNSTVPERKEQFRDQILRMMSFFERQYFVRFWEVIEILKEGEVKSWQYQGIKTIDTVQCNVWSHVLDNDFIAEVAFTVDRMKLRQSSYRTRYQQVLVSVDLYQTETETPDENPAISFRISNYQIDSNPISTELLYDTSMCYQNPKDLCTVQFKMGLDFATAHLYGLGAIKRAISKALVSETMLEPHQLHHISISELPGNLCLVTLTVYHGFGNNVITIHLFKEKLKRVINNRLTVTFANEKGDQIQVVHSVPNSLVFDYEAQHSDSLSVSVAATISMCIGTTFIGIIIGVIAVNYWFKKGSIMTTAGRLPNYRRFKDDEIEEVDIGL